MIQMNRLQLPEVIPQEELQAWRRSLPKSEAKNCPEEVRQFIDAVAIKLPDFEQFQKDYVAITGHELLLCGMKEMNGEIIRPWLAYQLPVPRMMAVDHHAAMHRIYHRKGKQGLIDFVKAKAQGSDLERLLEILNVYVFHIERPEFQRVMDDIMKTPKITLAEARRLNHEIRRSYV